LSATAVLASGAAGGQDNLYVAHESGGGWTVTHIATLSAEDEPDWYAEGFGSPVLTRVSSRVSPNGRYLTFMSNRSLTGYDNTDAHSGQPDEEVYLYDAGASGLVCASCDPTGARPIGVFDHAADNQSERLLVDRTSTWNALQSLSGNHWLAGSIPSWDYTGGSGMTTHQPRYLSDSGRLFFDSPDALVPQATNGLEDVYEYEPVGVGDCTTVAAKFSERSDGCVSLISSGSSSEESAFYDASENGDDAFFITVSKLVGGDYDNSYDVYDAHVCGSEGVACASEPVSAPACSSGDSCKAAPSPQPEIFGPTPSATFSGVGNVIEEAKPPAKAKGKPKPKLKKAKKKPKRRRKTKARRARAGVRRSRAGGADRKGGR